MTLLCAMVLDAVFGEPKWLWDRVPHPAVLIGRAIGWSDARFNSGKNRKAKGTALVVVLLLSAFAIGPAIAQLGWWAEAILAAVLLAQRSLVEHVQKVADGLRYSLSEGKSAVAMIVGRDTGQMDAPAVARSAIESAAENLSDGVTAPLFWFALAGLPGILAYKAINTADSMIGYRTPRHAQFGWAAARLDDVLNWVPARLTAVLILVAHGGTVHWKTVTSEAPLHRSPNAGWPESAMARIHGIALSGPRAYDGALRDFPFVNKDGRKSLAPSDIDKTIGTLWRVWAVCLGIAVVLCVI